MKIRLALRWGHADILWDREVEDPREDAWVVHDHLGPLGGRVAAPLRATRAQRTVLRTT